MNLEERLLDWLAKGWRVHLKTHIVPPMFVKNLDAYPYRDGNDGIGWCFTAFAYGAKRDSLDINDNHRSGAVAPTIHEAFEDIEIKLNRIEDKLNRGP